MSSPVSVSISISISMSKKYVLVTVSISISFTIGFQGLGGFRRPYGVLRFDSGGFRSFMGPKKDLAAVWDSALGLFEVSSRCV